MSTVPSTGLDIVRVQGLEEAEYTFCNWKVVDVILAKAWSTFVGVVVGPVDVEVCPVFEAKTAKATPSGFPKFHYVIDVF